MFASQGQICLDGGTDCHTEIEVADPTFYLTQSQDADTEPTSLSAGATEILTFTWWVGKVALSLHCTGVRMLLPARWLNSHIQCHHNIGQQSTG